MHIRVSTLLGRTTWELHGIRSDTKVLVELLFIPPLPLCTMCTYVLIPAARILVVVVVVVACNSWPDSKLENTIKAELIEADLTSRAS